jgi:hypothetical protein
VLGFDTACGADEVFRALVLARVVEPVSKLDTIRVLTEIGVVSPGVSHDLAAAARLRGRGVARAAGGSLRSPCGVGSCHLGGLRRHDAIFPTDQGDGFREPGFSKERRLEPQITVGLLTDARGFPLMVHAFEGNKAETKTILPVVQAFA